MTPIRCPACRADNAGGPACRRCKADLSLLAALEGRRASLLASAREALERGDVAAARSAAETAHSLRRGPDSCRWLAAVSILDSRFADAWTYYHKAGADG